MQRTGPALAHNMLIMAEAVAAVEAGLAIYPMRVAAGAGVAVAEAKGRGRRPGAGRVMSLVIGQLSALTR